MPYVSPARKCAEKRPGQLLRRARTPYGIRPRSLSPHDPASSRTSLKKRPTPISTDIAAAIAAAVNSSRLCGFAHHHAISTQIHCILFQGFGWWAADIFSVQIEVAVVASAPNMVEVGPVLDDASEVSANSRKSPEFSSRSSNQDSGLATKTKNLP